MEKPTCRKCGAPHYNFVPCADRPAFERVEHARLNPRELGARGYRSDPTAPQYGRITYRHDHETHEYDQRSGVWLRRKEPDV